MDNLLLENGDNLLLEDGGLVLLEIQQEVEAESGPTVRGDLYWASGLAPRRRRAEEPDDEPYDESDDVAALLLTL